MNESFPYNFMKLKTKKFSDASIWERNRSGARQ